MTTTIPYNHLRIALQRIADRKTYQGPVLTPQDMRRGAEAVFLFGGRYHYRKTDIGGLQGVYEWVPDAALEDPATVAKPQ